MKRFFLIVYGLVCFCSLAACTNEQKHESVIDTETVTTKDTLIRDTVIPVKKVSPSKTKVDSARILGRDSAIVAPIGSRKTL